MTWEKRYEELILIDSEEESLKELVSSVLERTEPTNPLEFGFLSEQFARLIGYEVAQQEQKAKEEYVRELYEDSPQEQKE